MITFTHILRCTAALTTFAITASMASAQSAKLDAEQTQTRGYWIDSSTGLMWARKDNSEDVSWKKAVKYCLNLRLDSYSDWRLASLVEMQTIYDKNVESPGLMGAKRYHNVGPSTWHVKGGIYLTGEDWTSTRRYDDRGKPSGYAWRYDFNEGREFGGDEEWFAMGKRALCVSGLRNQVHNQAPSLQPIEKITETPQ